MSHAKRAAKLSLSLLSVSLLAACGTLQPQPLAEAVQASQVAVDRTAAREGVTPVTGPLSLEEAQARALKFNLERRVKMMDEALALGQVDLTRLDMLPNLLAQAGYTGRNNDRISRSREAGDADGSLVPSRFISEERSSTLSELGLTWSLLDFGVGYLNTQQQGDRYLVAMEKRRKAMHLLLQDVRVAFWRAASAQRMHQQVGATIALAEEALIDARKTESARVRNPADTLRYQRQLLENVRLLEAIAQELSSAQVDLAHLINAPLGQPLQVVEPADPAGHEQVLQRPIEALEEVALMRNPDLREHAYNARMARLEARKTLLAVLPNLSFSYRLYQDTDSFLVNNRWNQVGTQLSWDLMRLVTHPQRSALAEASVKLADQRRVTAQAAVLAQVHLARLQLAHAVRQLRRASEIHDTDRRLAEVIANREKAQMQSKLDRVGSDAAAILSELRRYQALAAVHAATARLEASLGLEPQIAGVVTLSVEELTRHLQHAQRWQFPPLAALQAEPVSAPPVAPVMPSTSPSVLVVPVPPSQAPEPAVQPAGGQTPAALAEPVPQPVGGPAMQAEATLRVGRLAEAGARLQSEQSL